MTAEGAVPDGAAVRFRDPAIRLPELAADEIDVVCPHCGCRAVVSADPVQGAVAMHSPRRFVCTRCVTVAQWPPKVGVSRWGGPIDPYFHLPLWFQARCCGGRTLWAFNEAHLTLLADYVGAKLRERHPREPGLTMVARLPGWLKAADNRTEVLRTIARLRHRPTR
ncbi:hypothetical protein ACWT_1958 [Actinoplanes sp. SE50]|uniref:hypothetical protein n=1 Tax=unclassified Actinoplanes TaxID=2626549 RepID=UPI00023EC07F|nr:MULTISPECIES: hypothetical protein [unclassified Actinoplanes]AEV82977.1 hypothetical protein ACPL_2080 [Actinoplanes sp. SE50/110]ATO81373.1 hypothetical protein ACWT_1958 [Actinoplanes sp. SE50]SLL98780.1 hypothetical protein ACSP50_2007 [Actinoplanes sp. SE50/110]